MLRKLFALLLIGLMPMLVFSQEINKAKLDSLFQVLDANNKFMGGVCVSKNDEIIYTNTIGYADLKSEKKADAHSKYRIGSISKTFTAVLVLRAVEENKLELDETIVKYFPGIIYSNVISIRQLLYHRSGIHNYTDEEDYSTWNTFPKSQKEMVDIIMKAGNDFTPDSIYSYSNSNYLLLSYILSDVYKKPYAQLLEEKITKPLGLKDTYFGGKIDLAKNECNSYTYTTEWLQSSETDMSVAMGAGGIVSTAFDLVKFHEALFSGKLLTSESLTKMTTEMEGTCMGIFPLNFYSTVGFGHTGGIDGFNALTSYFPLDSVSFSLVCNGANYNTNDIAVAVMSCVYDLPFTIPVFKTITLTTEDLDKYLGVYSNPEIPIKLTITKNDNILMAQGTGQPSIILEASDIDIFRFDQAGLIIEFKPADNQLIINQAGGTYLFTKE